MSIPCKLTQAKSYWAFLSYSHSDTKETEWLHKALENYKIPGYLIGTEARNGVVPRRVFPVFRDRDELPTSSDLGENLHGALRNSRYLIVVCSPRSAKSVWVDAEVNYFKKIHGGSNVLCLIVDGVPGGTGDGASAECFCPSLKRSIGPVGETGEPVEPIAADLREGKDGRHRAFLKIAAGVLGVDFDTLYQRDKKRRRNRLIAFSVVTGIAALLIAGIYSRLGSVADSQSKMESQVRQMRESKFRDFGSLPESQMAKLRKIVSDSEILLLESELSLIDKGHEETFRQYHKTLDLNRELADGRFAKFVTEKNILIRKIESFLDEVKPADGWGVSEDRVYFWKNGALWGYNAAFKKKTLLDKQFQMEDEQFRNRKGIYAGVPEPFLGNLFKAARMNYELRLESECGPLPAYEKAFENSIHFSNRDNKVKEIADDLLKFAVGHSSDVSRSESEELKIATASFGGIVFGTDDFNSKLTEYRKTLREHAKNDIDHYIANDDSIDFGNSRNDNKNVLQWDKEFSKRNEQIGIMRKTLTPEESMVFQRLLDPIIETLSSARLQTTDKLQRLRVDFNNARRNHYEHLIESRRVATGWGTGDPKSYTSEEFEKANYKLKQLDGRAKGKAITNTSTNGFGERIWNRPRNRISEKSIEVQCISRFLFKHIGADGIPELDEERIRMAQQFALLISTALWVD
jgi:hypothetical protein